MRKLVNRGTEGQLLRLKFHQIGLPPYYERNVQSKSLADLALCPKIRAASSQNPSALRFITETASGGRFFRGRFRSVGRCFMHRFYPAIEIDSVAWHAA